jgi:hypothetical protein
VLLLDVEGRGAEEDEKEEAEVLDEDDPKIGGEEVEEVVVGAVSIASEESMSMSWYSGSSEEGR